MPFQTMRQVKMQTIPVDFSLIQQYDSACLSRALRKLVPNDQSWSMLDYLMEGSFSNGSSVTLNLWDGRQDLDPDE